MTDITEKEDNVRVLQQRGDKLRLLDWQNHLSNWKKRTSYVRFMAQFKELSTSRTFTARGTERWHPEGLAISAVSQLVTDDCDVDATLTLSPKWRFVPNLKKFPPGVPEISRLEGQTTGKKTQTVSGHSGYLPH